MSTIACPAIFLAYNTSNTVNLSLGGVFPIQETRFCGGGAVNSVTDQKAYLYGEIQSDNTYNASYGYYRTNFDIGLTNCTTLPSQGWQIGSQSDINYNRGDDGVYGVVEGGNSQLKIMDIETNPASRGYSDQEETRVFGIRLT